MTAVTVEHTILSVSFYQTQGYYRIKRRRREGKQKPPSQEDGFVARTPGGKCVERKSSTETHERGWRKAVLYYSNLIRLFQSRFSRASFKGGGIFSKSRLTRQFVFYNILLDKQEILTLDE